MHAPAAPPLHHHQAEAADHSAEVGWERGRPRTTIQQHRHHEKTSAGRAVAVVRTPQRHVRLATRHSPTATAAALPPLRFQTFRFPSVRATSTRHRRSEQTNEFSYGTTANRELRATGINKRFPFISATTIRRHQSDQVVPRTNEFSPREFAGRPCGPCRAVLLFRLWWVPGLEEEWKPDRIHCSTLLIQLRSAH